METADVIRETPAISETMAETVVETMAETAAAAADGMVMGIGCSILSPWVTLILQCSRELASDPSDDRKATGRKGLMKPLPFLHCLRRKS